MSEDHTRDLSTSSSEAVSLLPPGSASASDREVLVPRDQGDTSSSFPYLDVGKLSKRDRFALQSKLLKDSDNIVSEFGDLIHYTINSIVASRVSVMKLCTRLSSLGAYRPTRDPVPLLQNQLNEIKRAEHVEEVFSILDYHYSFFNYGIIEKIVGWFGTQEDKERLEAYTEHFKRFCKRRLFECPPDIFGHAVNKGKTNLVVKVEESWDPSDGCSLESVLHLRNSLAEILRVESEVLYLCRIDKGCVELLFQVPSFVEEDIFPLSIEQERSLVPVGVTRLNCGSYSYLQPPEPLAPQMSAHAESQVRQKPLKMNLEFSKKRPLRPHLPFVKKPTTPPPLPGGLMLQELLITGKKYQLCADDLEYLGHLGEGTYATVSKMSFPQAQTTMAVKKIRVKTIVMDAVHIWKDVDSPYTVKIFGYLLRDEHLWICMELKDSSMERIAERVYHQLHCTIPEEILGKMTVAAVKALDVLISEYKITHRDIKPSNVLVSTTGEFKLSDFYVIYSPITLSPSPLRGPYIIGRSHLYIAPERVMGSDGYSIKSDVWSLGITLLELALGTHPYSKGSTVFEQLCTLVQKPPPKLPDDGRYSKEMQEFAAACLTKDPAERPDHKQLQEYSFFRNYDSADVDTAGWYQSIATATL